MAKFYPTISGGFHGSEGEGVVYEALQKLGGEYTIFHSFRWLGEDGRWRSEGEADFLVLHPRLGVLSVEVKAGGIDYREGNWIQINRKNKSEKIIRSRKHELTIGRAKTNIELIWILRGRETSDSLHFAQYLNREKNRTLLDKCVSCG